MNILKRQKSLLLFFFIFFIATYLRLIHLSYSFDWDEIYTAIISNFSYISLISGVRYDPGNPPLHFILLKAWKGFFGVSEQSQRQLSVLFFSISLITLYKYSKKYSNLIPQYILLILYSGSSTIYYFSRYSRAYMLVTCIAVSVLPLLIEFLTKKQFKWTTLYLSLILCVIGLYSHYSFVIFYGMFFLSSIIMHYKSKIKLKRLVILTLLLFYFYLPWTFFFIKNQIKPSIEWYKYDFHQLNATWGGITMWLNAYSNNLYSKIIPFQQQQIISYLFIFLMNISIILTLKKERLNILSKHILLLFILYFNILMFTPLHNIFVSLHYSVYLIPLGIISFVILIDTYLSKRKQSLLLLLSILFTISTYPSYKQLLPNDFRDAAQNISLIENDGVILYEPCHLGFGINYYYHNILPEYCFFENPEGMYLPIWKTSDESNIIIVRYKFNQHKLESPYHKLKTLYEENTKYFGDIEIIKLIKKT
ncbi:glycosyltransferase family 39 protein [Patescibacteria group bacterium]